MELAPMCLLNKFVDLCDGFMCSAVVKASPNNLLEEFTNVLPSIVKAFHNDSFIARRFKIVDLVNVIFALVSYHHCRVVYIRTRISTRDKLLRLVAQLETNCLPNSDLVHALVTLAAFVLVLNSRISKVSAFCMNCSSDTCSCSQNFGVIGANACI